MKDIKPYIDYLLLSKIDKSAGLELLKGDNTLSSDEKNLIYCYCYPRPLLDRELPNRIQEYRKVHGIPYSGSLKSTGEALLLVEAFRTEQYSRFMKHLIYSFSNPENIYPVSGDSENECPICGKKIYDMSKWENECKDDEDKEFLAFGSSNSSIVLCKDCLVQLITANGLLESIDPDYLDWRKQYTKSIKHAREELKL